MLNYAFAAIAGYLLGNVQFAVILSKFMYHDDVRNHGSGNAGSTNMLRVYGLKSGLVTFVGDFSKGILAVLIGRWIGGEVCAYLCALFTVLGHDFPVFLKFKGGKGVASTFAIIWMLNPLLGGITTVAVAAVLFFTRTVAIASISCSALYAIMTAVFYWQQTELVIFVMLLCGLILLRHVDNIKRIIRGEESKLFEKKKKTAA